MMALASSGKAMLIHSVKETGSLKKRFYSEKFHTGCEYIVLNYKLYLFDRQEKLKEH